MQTPIPPTNQQQASQYEQDFYRWLIETAQKIRNQNFAAVDWDNVAEELETLGRSEKRELRSCLLVLLEHLLKLAYWQAEREYNARGWNHTIVEQRQQIEFLLKDSPSLKPIISDLFDQCYTDAKKVTRFC